MRLQEAVKQLLQQLQQTTPFVRLQKQLLSSCVILVLALQDKAPSVMPVEVCKNHVWLHMCMAHQTVIASNVASQ